MLRLLACRLQLRLKRLYLICEDAGASLGLFRALVRVLCLATCLEQLPVDSRDFLLCGIRPCRRRLGRLGAALRASPGATLDGTERD